MHDDAWAWVDSTEGDARHLDSAYKSGCRAFLTTDKRSILRHGAQLKALLGFQLFHPDEDRAAFLIFVNAIHEHE